MKKGPYVLACLLSAALAAPTVAQSTSDGAAWSALTLTPVGAFPAMLIEPGGSGAQRLPAWALRGTFWKFQGSSDQNASFGGSYVHPVGTKAFFTGTVGYFKPGGGGDGTFMFGGDIQNPIFESAGTKSDPMNFSISARGSAGLGHYSGSGGGTFTTLVGSLPVAIHYPMANKSVLSANVTPGFGWGRSADDFSKDSGTRPMISFGGTWLAASGTGIHVGVQKVIIDGSPPWLWGFAFSFVPGK